MKKLIQKASLFLFISFLSTPSVSTAQAWTKSKNNGFYKLDFSSIRATDVFDSKGEVVGFRTLGNYITSFYGEYGITNKLTAVAYVPFFVRNTINATKGRQTGNIIEPAIVNNNFGDVDLGIRYAIFNKKGVSVSANILLGLPTGDAKQTDGLFTGDGEFNQMLKIAVGTGKKKWWTQGALGLNNRTKGFSDEFRYDFEFGYKLFNDRLLAIFKINGIESLSNGTSTEKAAATGLFSNNVEYMGLGPELLYYINKKKTIGASFRIAGALKGQNVLAAPSIAFGVFAEL
jgi:protein XagA